MKQTMVCCLLFFACLFFFPANASSQSTQHHTIVVISALDNLPEQDVELTLAINHTLSYRIEALPDIGLIRDSEASTFLTQEDVSSLWSGGKETAILLRERFAADIILVGRHTSPVQNGAAFSFRAFYMPLDGTVRTAKIDFILKNTSDTRKLQIEVLTNVVDKLPFDLPSGFVDGQPITASKQAFRLFGKALNELRKNRTEAALSTFSKGLEAAPDFRDLKYFLGEYFVMGHMDYERSIHYLELITEDDPNDAGAHYWMGFVYRLKGQYRPAVKQFEMAAKLKTRFLEANIHLGHLHMDMGDPGAAAKSFQAALDIAPHVPSIWYSLATALTLTGQLDDAVDALRRALEIDAGTFYTLARSDIDLRPLRKLPKFIDLMEEMEPQR